ncbi:MAG: aspartate kinase [Bacteroidetes bacterium]|nr:aspartate kinase [Bacteroidota bacterium]
MDIKVFKFGGASVNSAKGVRNVASIIGLFPGDSIVMIISAMGKTTNALEEVLKCYLSDDTKGMETSFERMKDFHFSILNELFKKKNHRVFSEMEALFDELHGSLRKGMNKAKKPGADFEYDRVVSYGEIFATTIVHHYLLLSGIPSRLFDSRELVRTDSSFRDARVDWNFTGKKVRSEMKEYFSGKNSFRKVAVLQGFIGGDQEGNTTTLGREGSDYTAAIVAHSLGTREVTIWKDVPGVMNADPKWFKNAKKLDLLTYHEAIELAYYGASVIHPKTIKPLENANITLRVRSFLKPLQKGTTVEHRAEWKVTHPIYILKQNQVLISLSPRDFSFIVEENLSQIFDILARHHVKVNVMQNSAISFTICVDADRISGTGVLDVLRENYTLRYNDNVELLTIRHYNPAAISRITKGRKILMEQKTRNTIHLVVK